MKYILILIAFISFAGCTARGWYEGMQQSASRDCEKYPYQSAEYEKCIEKTRISYDQYQNETTDEPEENTDKL
ncbi:MAG: hypothetical protein HQK62_03890 [Desulfamplus sp.]|nr:hypothetical protein [Desulfamplus sp.]